MQPLGSSMHLHHAGVHSPPHVPNPAHAMLHACACSAKRVVFSRAYINFTNPDSVLEFKQAFDGHLFVGTKGNQYRCAVEYAPYQKMPVAAAKKDPRDGTIVKGEQ